MAVSSKEKIDATRNESLDWESFDFARAEKEVHRLQARIVKAVKEGKWGKVNALQRLLTHSFNARVLAVKRVTTNKGKNTSGVDKKLWRSNYSKEEAVKGLKQRGYKSLPLRRVLIPKSNGKMRPLGIPAMKDRAMQALYLLALDPVAETRADPNSYGFRKARGCADAIQQCFNVLCRKNAAEWILEGDIKACFDEINHDWLMTHVPLGDKHILQSWLKAGYLYANAFHNTTEGTPQGGLISPTLANLTLDGLERKLTPWTRKRYNGREAKVHFVRYADDFIITCSSKELLVYVIGPIVTAFFAERGLTLSTEKTVITHISEGFDFLGQNVRKYDDKIRTKPSKKSVHTFLEKIRTIIKGNKSASAYNLILLLNPVIQGWTNYHRHVCSSKTFAQTDTAIFKCLWWWAKRRHRDKNRKWVADKYFGTLGKRNWRFFGETQTAKGQPVTKNWLALAVRTRHVSHVKIRAKANPYDPADAPYFAYRKALQKQNRIAKPNTDYSVKDDKEEIALLNTQQQTVTKAASGNTNPGV